MAKDVNETDTLVYDHDGDVTLILQQSEAYIRSLRKDSVTFDGEMSAL